MNEIIQFFKERKWYYLLILIVGIAIYRMNIHPISAYCVAVFLMTVFSLMKETSLSIKENVERVGNRRNIDKEEEDWSWLINLLVLIAKILAIGIAGVYLLWEIYNLILWLTI